MEKIVLEYRFTNHQKITFLLYIGAPFLIRLILELGEKSSLKSYLIILFCILVYTFLITVALLRRGLMKIDSSLYKGSFFREKLFFKTKIELSGKSKIAILKLKKAQKLAWFSDAKPDLSVK